jgi:hypothetical protein
MGDRFREECGIVGVFGHPEAANRSREELARRIREQARDSAWLKREKAEAKRARLAAATLLAAAFLASCDTCRECGPPRALAILYDCCCSDSSHSECTADGCVDICN